MLWCPHGHDEAMRRAARAGRRDPAGLRRRRTTRRRRWPAPSELLESAYVVDLAWLRTTPWRERLAASFDLPERLRAARRPGLAGDPPSADSAASALLLAGWLASRLRWKVEPLRSDNGSRAACHRARAEGPVEIELDPLEQEAPGLAGVTAACGSVLAVARPRQGRTARPRAHPRGEHEWQVLGASRGEGGILGEGVRQALLRDPTYGPALGAARELSP